MLEIGVSVLRTKIKIPQNQRFHGIFDGRSDWIRTSGHLNPIQVLYQTEPHPDVANFFAYHKTRKRLLLIATNLLLFPQNALRWHFAGALWANPYTYHKIHLWILLIVPGLLLIPKNASVFGRLCAVFLRQFQIIAHVK